MNTKKIKIGYNIITGLFTMMIIATIVNSIVNPEFSKRFVEIGYPIYLILPLMLTKVLGLSALWISKLKKYKEWAYSGFFFLLLIALLSEINAKTPDYFSPPIALVLLITSYVLWKKLSLKKI